MQYQNIIYGWKDKTLLYPTAIILSLLSVTYDLDLLFNQGQQVSRSVTLYETITIY